MDLDSLQWLYHLKYRKTLGGREYSISISSLPPSSPGKASFIGRIEDIFLHLEVIYRDWKMVICAGNSEDSGLSDHSSHSRRQDLEHTKDPSKYAKYAGRLRVLPFGMRT